MIFRGNPNGFPLVAASFGAHILLECRNFTLSVSRGVGKQGCAAQKCDSACASDLARVNLGKLLPAIYCDFRGNPNGFPLVAASFGAHILLECRNFTLSVSRGVGKQGCAAQKCDSACASDLARVNLGKLLPAIYCDFRGNPNGFPLVAASFGAHILLECRNFTLSVSRGVGKQGCAAQKCDSACASNY